MSRAARRPAVYVDCPGVVNDGVAGHAMRDNCWNCAPFWEQFPTCPDDHAKLSTSGYCKRCRRHFALECEHTNVARPTDTDAHYRCVDCRRALFV